MTIGHCSYNIPPSRTMGMLVRYHLFIFGQQLWSTGSNCDGQDTLHSHVQVLLNSSHGYLGVWKLLRISKMQIYILLNARIHGKLVCSCLVCFRHEHPFQLSSCIHNHTQAHCLNHLITCCWKTKCTEALAKSNNFHQFVKKLSIMVSKVELRTEEDKQSETSRKLVSGHIQFNDDISQALSTAVTVTPQSFHTTAYSILPRMFTHLQ